MRDHEAECEEEGREVPEREIAYLTLCLVVRHELEDKPATRRKRATRQKQAHITEILRWGDPPENFALSQLISRGDDSFYS